MKTVDLSALRHSLSWLLLIALLIIKPGSTSGEQDPKVCKCTFRSPTHVSKYDTVLRGHGVSAAVNLPSFLVPSPKLILQVLELWRKEGLQTCVLGFSGAPQEAVGLQA